MFAKKERLPENVRAVLRKTKAESPLAWTSYVDDTNPAQADSDAQDTALEPHTTMWAVATRKALYCVNSELVEVTKISWCDVDRAGWEPATRRIRVSFTTSLGPLVMHVPQEVPVRFLTVLRERVENSVIMSETVPLTSAESARVAVRRAETGDLFIQVVCDPGVDPNAPEVMRLVHPVVGRLREVSGAH
ncbi:hypothetical protein [Timonella sp. A28]|uniref:hypothetical protein n=1 Tax=Timonella sp. A28 TaxID=3442640 RepID=UPI003EC0C26D